MNHQTLPRGKTISRGTEDEARRLVAVIRANGYLVVGPYAAPIAMNVGVFGAKKWLLTVHDAWLGDVISYFDFANVYSTNLPTRVNWALDRIKGRKDALASVFLLSGSEGLRPILDEIFGDPQNAGQ